LEKEVTSVLTKDERETLRELLVKLHEHLAPEGQAPCHTPLHGGHCRRGER